MGLTLSLKTAKNLAVRRKNCQILTVSRKKQLTVKFFISTICHFESILIPKTDIWLRSGRVIFREPEVSAFPAWIELTDSSLFKLFLGSSVSSLSV